MLNRILLAVALSPVLVTFAFAQNCSSNNLVDNPPPFVWKPGSSSVDPFETGTLIMDKATLDINGESLITRVYAQQPEQEGEQPLLSIPGPTLEMEAGKKYVMRFNNLLPYEPLTHEHNTFTDPNVTNVHTHGLHISGESPGDDVTRAFEGRRGGDYVYDIPADHMSGTYWYHAHHHGSTFLQVSSGAFGLIIIRNPGQDALVPQSVKDMQERHLILGYLEPGNAAGTGGDTLIDGTFSAGWTINGTVNGDVCMPPDTWQNWRMLVADQDARLVDLEIGDGCDVALMARDGVWRTVVPKEVTDNTLTLTGASRADLAVRCSSDSTITVGGVQVANILVDSNATADPGPSPYDTSTGEEVAWSQEGWRPDYLRDLRNEPVGNSESMRMGARSVLGRKFEKDNPNLVQGLTGVQEYSLNGAVNHPFHLHIYHVQVQNDCGPFEGGEYYDVVAGNCDLRFDLSNEAGAFEGRTIFHCHILQHEDQGAMGWLKVTGGKGPPILPETFQEYYDLDAEPPGGPAAPTDLEAVAVTSDQISLAWTDSPDEESYKIERDSQVVESNWPANSTSYTDTGLDPSTTYTYRVAASKNGVDSYSTPSSATTKNEGGDPPSVQVQSVVVSTVNEGKGVKSGLAVITIVDNLGNPLNGAFVSGTFSGNVNEDANGTTDENGIVSLSSPSAKPLNNLTFCVTDATYGTLDPFTGSECSSL